jgi:hypothetical protein
MDNIALILLVRIVQIIMSERNFGKYSDYFLY